jgi:hypothetical protein
VTWHQRELTLEDILSDPITNEVIKADGVDPHQLSAKLKGAARTWADAHARVGGNGGSIIGADRR